ncbi:glycosyltransferase [Fluviispira sanaruensis]|uniref:Glycosyltransferase family 4 protein n=1 Tax=Fluviispira sanaruensis TaxID=2493639 RepID=A0A4P2VWR4_FLUSA|nr:glycosyltransferase [Fluviispira sanaruensis]BBH54055.1 glycosyltransferase family 4 protein [Fluviispira sanaruensis]
MNIVILPSWHPDKNNPLAGLFFREQAIGLARQYPQVNFHFIEINSNDFLLSPRFLYKSIYNLIKFTFSSKNISIDRLNSNLLIYRKNHINWSFLHFKKLRELYFYCILKKNINIIEMDYGKISLLHAHVSFPSGFNCYKLKEEFNIPFVITEHMGPFPFAVFDNKKDLFERYIKKSLHESNRVISISHYMRNEIIKKVHRDSIVIPNMCNESVFYPKEKRINNKNFTFIVVCSSLSKEKGIDNLFYAIKRSTLEMSAIHFNIIGNGIKMQNYMYLAKTLNIENFITFYGIRNRLETAELYRNADAFIQPSEIESFSIACIEALATGIPILSTICGGPEDIVNENNGILVKNKSIEDLANGIISMINKYHLYNQNDIRNEFMEKYSEIAVCNKIMACYLDVTKNN